MTLATNRDQVSALLHRHGGTYTVTRIFARARTSAALQLHSDHDEPSRPPYRGAGATEEEACWYIVEQARDQFESGRHGRCNSEPGLGVQEAAAFMFALGRPLAGGW